MILRESFGDSAIVLFLPTPASSRHGQARSLHISVFLRCVFGGIHPPSLCHFHCMILQCLMLRFTFLPCDLFGGTSILEIGQDRNLLLLRLSSPDGSTDPANLAPMNVACQLPICPLHLTLCADSQASRNLVPHCHS